MTEPAAKLTSIRPEVDNALVERLESWLEDAKRGELIGAVLLGQRKSSEYQYSVAGNMRLSMSMVAFEAYKLGELGVIRRD